MSTPTSLPLWHNALQHLLERHAHLPQSRFVSAATVREDGRPANRMLTFRFFLNDGRLVFTTDRRADKVHQLQRQPAMELCWYFTETRTQVRLLGEAVAAEPGDPELAEARMRTWRERTEQSRLSFAWPEPGEPLAPPQAFEGPAPQLPPDNFLLLLFAPQLVDVLELSPQPHRRIVFEQGPDGWQEMAVNP